MDRQQLAVMAIGAAHKAHKEFGVDPTSRVDVFGVLRDVGAHAFFRPLRSIYGAYLPTGEMLPGLLINSNLPLSVQRLLSEVPTATSPSAKRINVEAAVATYLSTVAATRVGGDKSGSSVMP